MKLYPCPSCPRHWAMVMPVGPTPCPVMLLAECPARDENKYGEPLVGKTGRELNHVYLPLISIPRSQLFLANSVLCSRKDLSNPEAKDAIACMSTNLSFMLNEVRPSILVPMGAVACSLWPEIEINKHHGLPLPGAWGSWQGILFPTYHPSAGIHNGSWMIALMNDFAALGLFYRLAANKGLIERVE